jgi:hypothetical protein
LIPLRTIEQVLADVKQPPSPFLIGIVSRSESILKWASLPIAALGGAGNDVIQRNPDRPKWRDGLAACDLVVGGRSGCGGTPETYSTDCVTANSGCVS